MLLGLSSCAELDEFSVSHEEVAFVGLNAVPSLGELVTDAPVGVPQFSDRVLHDDSLVELELAARELGTVFFDLLCVEEPFLHVMGELRVCDSAVVLCGGWSSRPLAPPK